MFILSTHIKELPIFNLFFLISGKLTLRLSTTWQKSLIKFLIKHDKILYFYEKQLS